MTTGEKIKAAREKAGFTQAELASKLGIPYHSIGQWERGLRNPKWETLEKIAEALQIPVYELIDGGFGALDPVLPPNMKGANLDGAKIDKNFLNSMLSLLSFLPRDSSDYSRSKENILSLAKSSGLLVYAQAILQKIEDNTLNGLYFLSSDYTESSRDKLLLAFDRLNEIGQKRAVENVEDLAKIPEYQKKDNEK